jgi:hypothetical protein
MATPITAWLEKIGEMVVLDLFMLGEKAELEVAPLEETKASRWTAMKEIAEWGALSVQVRDPKAPAALCSIVR